MVYLLNVSGIWEIKETKSEVFWFIKIEANNVAEAYCVCNEITFIIGIFNTSEKTDTFNNILDIHLDKISLCDPEDRPSISMLDITAGKPIQVSVATF